MFQFSERVFACARTGADEIQPRWNVAVGQHSTESATQSIATHGRTDGATDGERHLRRLQIGIEDERTPQRIGPDPISVAP